MTTRYYVFFEGQQYPGKYIFDTETQARVAAEVYAIKHNHPVEIRVERSGRQREIEWVGSIWSDAAREAAELRERWMREGVA